MARQAPRKRPAHPTEGSGEYNIGAVDRYFRFVEFNVPEFYTEPYRDMILNGLLPFLKTNYLQLEIQSRVFYMAFDSFVISKSIPHTFIFSKIRLLLSEIIQEHFDLINHDKYLNSDQYIRGDRDQVHFSQENKDGIIIFELTRKFSYINNIEEDELRQSEVRKALLDAFEMSGVKHELADEFMQKSMTLLKILEAKEQSEGPSNVTDIAPIAIPNSKPSELATSPSQHAYAPHVGDPPFAHIEKYANRLDGEDAIDFYGRAWAKAPLPFYREDIENHDPDLIPAISQRCRNLNRGLVATEERYRLEDIIPTPRPQTGKLAERRKKERLRKARQRKSQNAPQP